MLQIEKQREDYYRKLGTPPGVPTMKGATADPDNTGYGYNTIIGEQGDHSVPEGWVQRPKFNDKGDVPGPPIQWQKPEDPGNAQPGYGYVPTDTTNTEEIFFYHSDHLGSTSYITDAKANITQFDAYLPYGELLVDEHSSSEDMPYKFNGKELDEETGLYYYGARYMDPKISMWLGVDPLVEKYPSVNGYCYTFSDPIGFIDPSGQEGEGTGNTSWWGKNNMTTRAIGALQMVGGAVEAVVGGIGGLMTAETLAGAALGYAALLNGIDNTQAGFNQMWTGTTQQTLLHQEVETNARKLGATKQTAENIATGVDLSTIFLGGGTSLSTVRGLRATKAANNFFKDTKYTEKVMKQMGNSSDVFHGFSKSVDAYAAKYGKVTQIRGGDKKIYQMLTIKGSITDKSGKTINGTFEYIKTPTGEINHRFFKAATKKMKEELLKFLEQRRIHLPSHNVGDTTFVLNEKDALDFIGLAKYNSTPIIGADVLTISKSGDIDYILYDWGYKYIYLNWSCDRVIGETDDDYLSRSIEFAYDKITEIQKVAISLKKRFYISFVF